MNAIAEGAGIGTRWVSFELAAQRYAVDVRYVQEVIRPVECTPVPGAPFDVLGIINLRGAIVAVLDGRRRLGLPGSADAALAAGSARIVIFDAGGEPVGVLVDAISDVLELSDADIAPAPSGRAARAEDPVTGVLRRDDEFVALLDAARLVRARTETS